MDYKELRVGNYISYQNEDEDTIVQGIHFIDDGIYKILIGNYLRPLSQCFPILLTEYWLLKFGFEYKDALYIKGKLGLYCNCYRDASRKYEGFCHSTLRTVIRNVHQLHNLYYALTGEELEFKKVEESS
jgi:hypothetical protein